MHLLRYRMRARKYARSLESAEIGFVIDAVKPGQTAFDIGAHKGAYLYWLREGVGDTGQVYAFEPQKGLAAYLKVIVRDMKWDNVTVEHMGLCGQVGTLSLNIPGAKGSNSPSASFQPSTRDEFWQQDVAVTTLDDYCSQKSITQVDFIKCDAEGFEGEIFKGGAETLKAHHPTLLFECEQRHHPDSRIEDIFHYLEDLGYKGNYFGPGGVTQLDEFDIERDQPADTKPSHDNAVVNNFLFTTA